MNNHASQQKLDGWLKLILFILIVTPSLSSAEGGNNFAPQMITIKPGNFLMGEYSSIQQRERHGHKENISQAFEIGKYEVTVREFNFFVADTNYKTEAEKKHNCKILKENNKWQVNSRNGSWKNSGASQNKNHPVVCVSWNDTQKYIEWLNTKTGKAYRLPTEKEWEYVAREGNNASVYWANGKTSACQHANLYDTSAAKRLKMDYRSYECNDKYAWTSPVGKFKPNQFGVYDMLGNVWEWVEDCYESSRKRKIFIQDYLFPSCDKRVLKGGSFHYGPGNVYSGLRAGLKMEQSGVLDGFRLARDL